MSLNLPTTVFEILKENSEKKMTSRMIANEIFKKKRQECLEKKARSGFKTDDQLLQQIVAEIASMKELILKKDSHLKTIEERPRKFIYSFKDEKDEKQNIENKGNVIAEKEDEKCLYPKLCKYLWINEKIYPKRIDEKTSANSKGKNGNIWLHPDIVGFELKISNFEKDVSELLNLIDSKERFSIYSYEVKIKLAKYNVRESFIQAASNSSWANYGYLVASEIDESVVQECKMLANQFGIGLIRLDDNDPTENTEIIIQPKHHDLNWLMINRIYSENKDFQCFIKAICNSLKTNEVFEKKGTWDKPEIK